MDSKEGFSMDSRSWMRCRGGGLGQWNKKEERMGRRRIGISRRERHETKEKTKREKE